MPASKTPALASGRARCKSASAAKRLAGVIVTGVGLGLSAMFALLALLLYNYGLAPCGPEA